MSPEGFAYVAGGAGAEETMRENRDAFERWRIVPRMLRDVSVRDTATAVLGAELASPFVLCPIGVLEMAHRDADVAVARAAAAEGIPFVFSNQASRPMEETARAMGDAPRWFQLYWSTSNELVASLWNQRGASPIARAVSSIGRDAWLEKTNGMPSAAAARATATSASRCAISSTPMGQRTNGLGSGVPSTSVARVPARDVAKHPRDDPPALERRAVLAHRLLGAGAARDVGEALGGHGLSCRGSRRSNETGTVGYVPRAPPT